MKLIILVPDGAADYPQKDSHKTPLELASTPNMDKVVSQGIIGWTKNCPDDMPPGSDVANMSILGYDPHQYFTGRGPLEALSMGVVLGRDDMAFRCNLVTVEDGIMVDYSAGHISSQEADDIIEMLNERLADDRTNFYTGVSYRHLLVHTGGEPGLECTPPHDILGEPIEKWLPTGEGAPVIRAMMQLSVALLKDHPVNIARAKTGKNRATMIWPWGQGKAPAFTRIDERFGMTGGVISAVDLVKGLGRAAGLEVISVPGATGYYDTDYDAKAEAAIRVIRDADLVYVHVEAPDEASHEGNITEKILALERFDAKIVSPILDIVDELTEYRLLIVPDHATPLSTRTHAHDPVPFALMGTGVKPDDADSFTEAQAKKSLLGFDEGHRLIEYILGAGR